MRVLVLSNGEFLVKDIEPGLDALQKEVGGYIEIPHISNILHQSFIDIVINEEGKLNGLKPEILVTEDYQIVDIIVGTCVFTGFNADGETLAITDEQIEIVKEQLRMRALYSFNEEYITTRVLSI